MNSDFTENKADFFIIKNKNITFKNVQSNWQLKTRNMLPFILLIRHQQNPFKNVKCASSEKIKGWGMELFYSL